MSITATLIAAAAYLPQIENASKHLLTALNLGAKAYQAAELLQGDALKPLTVLFEERIGIAAQYPDGLSPRIGARHLELVSRAFGQAFRRHWAGWTIYTPDRTAPKWRDLFFKDKEERARMRQIESAMNWALQGPQNVAEDRPRQDVDVLGALLGDPLNTPYYRCLWEAFTGLPPDLQEKTPITEPLLAPNGEERRHFERYFRLAYDEGLATQAGQEIRTVWLGLATDRAQRVQELLLRDMANWGQRHVFGNVAVHQSLPPMPLDEMYVEPLAVIRGAKPGSPEAAPMPIQERIHDLLQQHRIVVITANFGHGKSLTARSLAAGWAKQNLAGLAPAPDLIRPIFVKCAEHLTSRELRLGRVVETAMQKQLKSLGLSVKAQDPACVMPVPEQATVFLIDGLDEVILGEKELDEWFASLDEEAAGRHSILVFSRPAALPRDEKLQKMGIPVLELQPFTTRNADAKPGGQVGQWLERWTLLHGGSSCDPTQLENRRLLDLAKTPILLFMIAHTWDTHAQSSAPTGRAGVYRQFLRQMARGKHEQDSDGNPTITEASEKLRDRLREKKLIDTDADAVDAMLWLLGRASWEAYCLEQQGQSLTTDEVRDLLRLELNLKNPAMERTIRIGLLLALQTNPYDENHEILFGHKSFREFLVASYWEQELGRLLSRSDRGRSLEAEIPLLGGRLLSREDASFEFLSELLKAWDQEKRDELRDWAEERFNDELLGNRQGPVSRFAEDQRIHLREAALALGSYLNLDQGIKARSPSVLRSLLAVFWLREEMAIIRAPNFNLQESHLQWNADLNGAQLQGANLHRANLISANFFQADLSGADLTFATLVSAQLVMATFVGAKLQQADLRGAALQQANLQGARLQEASLQGARLRWADLRWANLERANFQQADLLQANLQGADLQGADLQGAVLQRVNLQGADIRGTDLRGADLRGANLQGADLRGANLQGATYSKETQWDQDFDPMTAGAIPVDSQEYEDLAAS